MISRLELARRPAPATHPAARAAPASPTPAGGHWTRRLAALGVAEATHEAGRQERLSTFCQVLSALAGKQSFAQLMSAARATLGRR